MSNLPSVLCIGCGPFIPTLPPKHDVKVNFIGIVCEHGIQWNPTRRMTATRQDTVTLYNAACIGASIIMDDLIADSMVPHITRLLFVSGEDFLTGTLYAVEYRPETQLFEFQWDECRDTEHPMSLHSCQELTDWANHSRYDSDNVIVVDFT